jgi:hypothetical protein
VLVPTTPAGKFRGRAAPTERGEPTANDVPQPLLVASPAGLTLLDAGIGQAHVVEGLCEGRAGPLRRSLVTRETRMGCSASTSSRLDVCWGVSWVAGPGHLPRPVFSSMPGRRAIVDGRSHVPAGSELAPGNAIRRRPTADVSPYALYDAYRSSGIVQNSPPILAKIRYRKSQN